MKNLWSNIERRAPATQEDIRDAEEKLGRKLPEDYVGFLGTSNGIEGFIGRPYVILWGIEQLKSLNDSYQVETYAPGFILIGSDGGGEAYGFDTRATQTWPIVSIPFVGMRWEYARTMGKSFTDFLNRLCEDV